MDVTMTNWLDKMAQANQQILESTTQLSEIAARAHGRVLRHQLAAVETCMQAGASQMKLSSESRDPKEVLTHGTDAAMAVSGQMTEIIRESFEIQAEISTEISTWLEAGWKSATAQATVSTPSKTSKPQKAA